MDTDFLVPLNSTNVATNSVAGVAEHTSPSVTGWLRRYLHFLPGIILLLGFLPALRAAGLPVRLDWNDYILVFWLAFGSGSILLAGFLFALQWPKDCLALLNWSHKTMPELPQIGVAKKRLVCVLLPATYLFAGLILVVGYNDVIAASRFTGSGDMLLDRLDSRLLLGSTVSTIAHQAAVHLPLLFGWLGPVYGALFPLVGSCMILLSLRSSRTHSLQFVGTILIAYYLALIFFYFIPATGPYFLCPTHELTFAKRMAVYAAQANLSAKLNALRAHQSLRVISLDYYIGLPCMHIAQPIIVLWFVRRWRRIAALFLVYTILLLPTVLLLEQHYLVDVIAGVVTAVAAIVIVAYPGWRATTAGNPKGDPG